MGRRRMWRWRSRRGYPPNNSPPIHCPAMSMPPHRRRGTWRWTSRKRLAHPVGDPHHHPQLLYPIPTLGKPDNSADSGIRSVIARLSSPCLSIPSGGKSSHSEAECRSGKPKIDNSAYYRFLAVGGQDALLSLFDTRDWICVRTFDVCT